MQMGFVSVQPIPLTLNEQAVHERACLRAKHYLQSKFELMESIDEIDRLRIYEKFALTSTFSYCLKKLNLSETTTAYLINVARKSREVPRLKAAIENGDVSVSKAAKICSVLTAENQDEWITKAAELPKSQLEKAVAEAQPEKPRKPTAKPVGPNRTRVQFEGSDELMQLLKRAQELVSQSQAKSAKIDETVMAALTEFVERHDPVKRAERAEKRKAVPASAAKPASSRPSSETKPQAPTHNGRELMTAALEHELNLRDRGRCQIRGPDGEICGSSEWIHYHHITEVQHGGKNELANMITVCSAHHRLIHRLH